MNSIFKLLVVAVVFGVLVYIILQLFTTPKSDPYVNISQQILLAQKDAGVPVCSKLDLLKGETLSSKSVGNQYLLKDLNVFVWFASLNPKFKIISSNNNSIFKATQKYGNLDFCTICFPKIIFSKNVRKILNSKNFVCEIVLGTKLSKLNYNLFEFSKKESQGFNKISLNPYPGNYSYRVYIFDNPKKYPVTNEDISSFKFSKYDLEKEITASPEKTNDFNLEIPFAGNKIILQALVPSEGVSVNSFVPPSALSLQSVTVIPNSNYNTRNCVATTTEIQGINYDRQKCEVYNYCEGCFLPSDCSDAWKSKGIQAEEATNTYAESYLPLDKCTN